MSASHLSRPARAPPEARRHRGGRRVCAASTCWRGATSTTSRPADPRSTRRTSPRLWAEAGIEVTLRTSYAAGPAAGREPATATGHPQGRPLPGVPPGRAQRDRPAGTAAATPWSRSGTACRSSRRCGPRGPRIVFLHHVHAEMWKMVLPPNARPARRHDRAPHRPAAVPAQPDRHAVASRRRTRSSRTSASRADRVDGRPARLDPASPRRAAHRADAARRGRRPARARQALRPPDPGRRRGPPPRPRPHARHRRRAATSATRSRPWCGAGRRRLGDLAGRSTTTSSSTSTAGLARRQRVGPRGLGHDPHRGGGLRHARRRHPHRRPHRRGRRGHERAARRQRARARAPPSPRSAPTMPCGPRSPRAPLEPRVALHLGRHRARRAHGTRRGDPRGGGTGAAPAAGDDPSRSLAPARPREAASRGPRVRRLRPAAAHQARQSSADTKTYLYLDPGRLLRTALRCGTRKSAWARSPTRPSATCSRWAPTTG